MEGYTKLFSGITRSTVWTYDSDTRVIWIHLLAECDQNGVFIGTVPGLAQAAGIQIDKVRKAIATFLAPDPDSGSQEFEGRRIEVVDRGWRLLNHAKYRAMRSREEKQEADRVRIAAKRAGGPGQTKDVASGRDLSRPVAEVAHAEAASPSEAEAEAEEKKKRRRSADGPAVPGPAPKLSQAEDRKHRDGGPEAEKAARKTKSASHLLTRDVIAQFCDAWKAARGEAYAVMAKDAGQVNLMLRDLPAEKIQQLPAQFAAYVRDTDQFLEKQGHSLAFFCSQGLVNRYVRQGTNGVSRYGRGPIGADEDLAVVGEQAI